MRSSKHNIITWFRYCAISVTESTRQRCNSIDCSTRIQLSKKTDATLIASFNWNHGPDASNNKVMLSTRPLISGINEEIRRVRSDQTCAHFQFIKTRPPTPASTKCISANSICRYNVFAAATRCLPVVLGASAHTCNAISMEREAHRGATRLELTIGASFVLHAPHNGDLPDNKLRTHDRAVAGKERRRAQKRKKNDKAGRSTSIMLERMKK